MKPSLGFICPPKSVLPLQQREEDDVADGGGTGEHHDQAVDADAAGGDMPCSRVTPTAYDKLKTRCAGYGKKNAWKRSQFHDLLIAFDDEDYVPLLMK